MIPVITAPVAPLDDDFLFALAKRSAWRCHEPKFAPLEKLLELPQEQHGQSEHVGEIASRIVSGIKAVPE